MKPLRILSPIHKIKRQIEMYLEARVKALDCSLIEGHIVGYLSSYAPCPVAELVRVFGIKRSTLTSLLDRLESRELISRRVNPADRRSWLVEILPTGKKLSRRLRKIFDEFEKNVLSEISLKDLAGFDNLITAIAKITDVQVCKSR